MATETSSKQRLIPNREFVDCLDEPREQICFPKAPKLLFKAEIQCLFVKFLYEKIKNSLWTTWKKSERKRKPLSIVVLSNLHIFEIFFHRAQSQTSQPHHHVSCPTHTLFQIYPYGFLELKIMVFSCVFGTHVMTLNPYKIVIVKPSYIL